MFVVCGHNFASEGKASQRIFVSWLAFPMFPVCCVGKFAYFWLLAVSVMHFVVIAWCLYSNTFPFKKYIDDYHTLLKVCLFSLHILQLYPMFLVDCKASNRNSSSARSFFFIGGITFCFHTQLILALICKFFFCKFPFLMD